MHSGEICVGAVDDHPAMLQGLRLVGPDLPVPVNLVSSSDTVDGLLASGAEYDVVLLDLRLRDGSRPRDNVLKLIERNLKVVVYTEGDRRTWVADAIRAGAHAVVLKSRPLEELAEAIGRVHQGGPELSAEMAEVLAEDKRLRPSLSDREAEVLQLVAQGLADKQVARVLGVSEGTVKEYLKRIRTKYSELGRSAATRVDLVRRAFEDGHLEIEDEGGSTHP